MSISTTHTLPANYTRRLTSPATLQKGWYNTAPQEAVLGLSRAQTILSTVSSNGPTTQASSTAEHIQRIHECSTKFLQPGIHPLNTEWKGQTHAGVIHSWAYPPHTQMQHQIPAARIPPKFSYNGLITLDGLQAPAQQTYMLPANYTRRLTSPATLQKGWCNTAPQETVLGLSRAQTILSTVSSNGPTTQASSTAEHIQRKHECSTKFLQPGIHPLNSEWRPNTHRCHPWLSISSAYMDAAPNSCSQESTH